MGFGEAIRSGFQRYVDFSTRSSRSEYWFWVLFVLLGHVAAGVLDAVIFGGGAKEGSVGVIAGLFSLATFIPGLAVGIRRLHDIGRSGWWVLIALVPVIGVIVLIVFAVKPGQPGPNPWGPNPLEGGPAMA